MISDEQRLAIIEAVKNPVRHKPGSYEWARDNGYLGMQRRMNYEVVGRKLVMVDELPDGAYATAWGLQIAPGCIVVTEEW